MTAIKGILFDKDGTLIDFNTTWLPIYQAAATHLSRLAKKPTLASELLEKGGYQPTSNSWKADSVLASGSNQDVLNFLEHTSGIVFNEQIKTELLGILAPADFVDQPLIQALPQFMQDLKSKGYLLGVATMDDEAPTRHTLEKLDILSHLDFVCGADSGFGTKPEPGMIRAFCQHCRISEVEVMMVGDSPRDLKMARNAGAGIAAGVLSGASTYEDLEPIADIIVKNISELRNIVHDLAHKYNGPAPQEPRI